MKHVFETETGVEVHLGIGVFGLYTHDGKNISKPMTYSRDYLTYIESRDPAAPISKSSSPVMMKVILGHRCNYSCGYCLQDELSSKASSLKRAMEKKRALTFLEEVKKLDLSHLKRVELWGGETFLYWEEVQTLMSGLDHPDISFYLPTNGTLLDDKHADFFRTIKGKVCLGISHDGPAHTRTRGPEFLHKKVNILKTFLDMENVQFSFNPVISRSNYNLRAIDDFFQDYLTKNDMKAVPLMFEIIQAYSLEELGDSISHAIMGEDLPKYQEELRSYLDDHRLGVKRLPTNLYQLSNGVYGYLNELRGEEVLHSGTKCQADQSRQLSLDLDGNVRTCQNIGTEGIFGNIRDLASVQVTNLNTRQGKYCHICPVQQLCQSQCPIVQHEDIFDVNCAINKIHYGEIQRSALMTLTGQNVTYRGMK